MQKHLSLLADVRGCMTRFDPLTPQIVAAQSEDMEIARLLKISHKTVAYRKKIAMNRLRMLLEGMKDA